MKMLNKFVLLLAISFVSLSANAGLFGSIASSDWPIKETVKYKIEAYGFDVRIYEWVPEGNKNVRCVFAAGNENSTGVACYEVKK